MVKNHTLFDDQFRLFFLYFLLESHQLLAEEIRIEGFSWREKALNAERLFQRNRRGRNFRDYGPAVASHRRGPLTYCLRKQLNLDASHRSLSLSSRINESKSGTNTNILYYKNTIIDSTHESKQANPFGDGEFFEYETFIVSPYAARSLSDYQKKRSRPSDKKRRRRRRDGGRPSAECIRDALFFLTPRRHVCAGTCPDSRIDDNAPGDPERLKNRGAVSRDRRRGLFNERFCRLPIAADLGFIKINRSDAARPQSGMPLNGQ
ncbi:hypothetical protein EVAR_30474_1 [Eumeta japonica]|uniref:Uncharacterized protein n=1 Tax=Eumeta variegata TaxID=151549 RepID=A0A4C1W0A1_EUMVA|nr:hypothetical protein EVAR_30474_1 [Eumeta japonica]